jgi:hypothetical protein
MQKTLWNICKKVETVCFVICQVDLILGRMMMMMMMMMMIAISV